MCAKNMENMNLLNINNALIHLCKYIQIPYYRMKKNGDFVCPKEIKKEIEFVWLAMSRSCVCWDKYEKSSKPLCKASDGENPDGGTNQRQTICKRCPDSKWHGVNKNEKPLCSEIYTILCWDMVKNKPFYFQAKRTAIKPLKDFADLMEIFSEDEQNKIPYHVRVKLRLSSVIEKTKKYEDIAIPKFDILEEVEEKKAAIFQRRAIYLSKEMKNIRFENESEDHSFENDEDQSCENESEEQSEPCQDNPGIPGNTQPVNAVQNGRPQLPDVTKENWGNTKVGLKETGDMTWNDLAQDKLLPDGVQKGHYFLNRLIKWKEQWPEIAQVAMTALQYLCPELESEPEKEKTIQPPVKTSDQANVQPPANVLA